MPTPLLLMLIAILLPLLSAPILLLLGRRLGQLGALLSAALSGVSLICALAVLMSFLDGGTWKGSPWGAGLMPLEQSIELLPASVAGIELSAGLYLDSLSAVMLCVVTLVGFLVHVYSLTYMRSSPNVHRYFAALGMFVSAMLGLVCSSSLILTFVCWELVGACSYLLIGFEHHRPAAGKAAFKAFLVNRIADAGFLLALGTLAFATGSLNLRDIWSSSASLPDWAAMLAGIGLFTAAMAKSAQFPLHIWLLDAMEGPTPVSALIHAATMVAAGVYMLARTFVLLPDELKWVIAMIGAITALASALAALAQNDLKKLLAWSTASQLGLMMLALGSGAWTAALLHLCTHAMFKALLFLSAGAVIHATHKQKLNELGGLFKTMPFTASAFAIGALAISGAPLLAGYYSKDLILLQLAGLTILPQGGQTAAFASVLFITAAVTVTMTPLYIGRAFMRVFITPARSADAPVGYESTTLWVVQMAMVGLVAVAGYPWLSPPPLLTQMIDASRGESARWIDGLSQASALRFDQVLPVSGLGRQLSGASSDSGDEDNLVSDTVPQSSGSAPTTPAIGPDIRPVVTRSALAGRDTIDDDLAEKIIPKEVTPARQLVRQYTWPAWWAGLILAFVLWGVGPVERNVRQMHWLRLLSRPASEGFGVDQLLTYCCVWVARMTAVFADAWDRNINDGIVRSIGSLSLGVGSFMTFADKWLIDGTVEAVGSISRAGGMAVRSTQSGRIRLYIIMALMTLALAVASVVIWISLS